MKPVHILLLFLMLPFYACCQDDIAGKFRLVDYTTGDSITQHFHGISGMDYLPKSKKWILVSDRGRFLEFEDCKKITDFNVGNLTYEDTTGYYFESVRYDSVRQGYFFSVETDTYSAVYFNRKLESPSPQLILKIPLPATNKGIEAIALTPSGHLWIAPEAGWENETEKGNRIMHFYQYTNPMDEIDTQQPKRFKYRKTLFPAAAVDEDKLGGISEILALDDDHLLILERAYFNKPKDIVKATLKTVKVDRIAMELKVVNTFTFDPCCIPNLCNIEGMSWGDQEKRTLFIAADDGLGNTFYNNKRTDKNELQKPTLQNQIIILRRD